MYSRGNTMRILFFILLSSFVFGARAQVLRVDMSKKHQIIRGFGGIHINSWTGQTMTDDMQEKAFDNDPGEIGLSIFRLRIDPNSNRWSDELPLAQYAISQGAKVFASPWNPPSHMREILRQTNDYTDYVLLPEFYDDYVEHLNAYIAFMADHGVPLYAISVQNEPDWHGWTWWEPAQMLNFVREHADDINCRVIAPESLGYVRKMIDPLLNDSLANANIDILGTHLYGTPKANIYYPLALEKAKEIWMTEHLYGSGSPSENTWALALKVAEEINTCMDAGMSAFVYWYIRRFYGLINDDGNITDKGYVFSQFSKFIRPGAFRVEADLASLAGVSATAYESDSGLVMVLVNNNKTAVDLQFVLENLPTGIDTLHLFTTSSKKKVSNEGAFELASGVFSATLEPYSISTFTSDASKGGRQGNLPPVAFAGDDRIVDDLQGTGVRLTLSAAESSDADGEIVKYSWSANGYQLTSNKELEVELGIGTFSYVLTVTDNDGASSGDTIHLTVQSPYNTRVWLEAECTGVGDNWKTIKKVSASNGAYLTVTPGVQATAAPSSNSSDHLVYSFHLPENGYYKVWGRVLAPTPDDDSFWVRMDEGDWTNWNGIVGGGTWQWDDVHNQADNNPMVYELDSGMHTLTICYREDGAAIDKIYLSNTGIQPAGMGDEAFNCTEEPNSVYRLVEAESVKLFPNPAKSDFTVESELLFSTLDVFNINGQRVFSRSYHQGCRRDFISHKFEPGVYLVRLSTDEWSVQKQLLVGDL
ncbi:T9SS type A sorting domain-containing protein [Roseimarinus sediminis]|uniref:T9SS type A sorting domain-containing protein n=1 Tax=Roseimarinus sediminis TaxID=1610899 RepID=UPI003D24AB50